MLPIPLSLSVSSLPLLASFHPSLQIWGYLSVVCVRLKQRVEAEQAFKFALKLGAFKFCLCVRDSSMSVADFPSR